MNNLKFATPGGGYGGGNGMTKLDGGSLEDPFMTSENLSGKGNLFSPAPSKAISPEHHASTPAHGDRRGSVSSPPPGASMQSLLTEEEKNALVDFTHEAADSQDEGDNEYEEYGFDEYGSDDEEDAGTESAGDLDDAEGTDNTGDADGAGKKGKKGFVAPPAAFRDESGRPIGPDHPSVPKAMNNMQKYSNKVTEQGRDPNGRFHGRNLVMWHRPRMMDKLVLHIQYECHLANVKIPWDKVAHRLNPGSSGPAIVQFLNKQRDVLVAEGHMIPPNMGKSKAVYDDTIRGYVRDMAEVVPTRVRALPWNEKYEDKKESLVVPGMILGSGRYERNKENRTLVPKETGRRSRVPNVTKAAMNEIREKKGLKPAPAGSRSIKGKVNTPKVKVKTEDDDDDDYEVDPAKLKSDDEYEPGIKSSKRKAKGSSTGRKKARVDYADEADSDVTPCKSTRQSHSKSTTKSVGARAMGKLKIGTSSGTPSKSAPSSAYAAEPEDEFKVESAAVSEDEEDLNYVPQVGDFSMNSGSDMYGAGGQHGMAAVSGPITPPFGASPLDIQTQVQNGLTPSYSQDIPQSLDGRSQNSYGNFQPVGANDYRPPAGITNYTPFGSYSPNAYGDINYSDLYSQLTFNDYGGFNSGQRAENGYAVGVPDPTFNAYGGYSSSDTQYQSSLYPGFGVGGSVYNDPYDPAGSSQPGFSNQYDDPRLDQENIKPQTSDDL